MTTGRSSLTRKQAELLRFIETSLAETSIAPSFESMRAHLGLKSNGNVHRLVNALEERGFITRLPRRARSIALASPIARVPAYELMAELRRRGIPVKVDVL